MNTVKDTNTAALLDPKLAIRVCTFNELHTLSEGSFHPGVVFYSSVYWRYGTKVLGFEPSLILVKFSNSREIFVVSIKLVYHEPIQSNKI